MPPKINRKKFVYLTPLEEQAWLMAYVTKDEPFAIHWAGNVVLRLRGKLSFPSAEECEDMFTYMQEKNKRQHNEEG